MYAKFSMTIFDDWKSLCALLLGRLETKHKAETRDHPWNRLLSVWAYCHAHITGLNEQCFVSQIANPTVFFICKTIDAERDILGETNPNLNKGIGLCRGRIN
jgi:hypothetical protein